MDNRFFSLIVVPDSGNDVRSSRFNSQFLVAVFGVLIALFFTCLFFIIGYHVKLRQEKTYRTAVVRHQTLLSHIRKAEYRLSSLTDKIENIRKNDNAYRLFASMQTLDPDMYKAGVGGHVLFDPAEYGDLAQELLVRMEHLTLGVVEIDHQSRTEQASLGQIQIQIRKNHEIIENTPTILPAFTPFFSITSPFGARINPFTGQRQFHEAVDIDGRRGDKIVAAADGIVDTAEWKGALGQCVIIRHKYGYETTYGHLDTIKVTKGMHVRKGDFIGTMGSTGRATGVHLHYMVCQNGRPVNPVTLFKAGL